MATLRSYCFLINYTQTVLLLKGNDSANLGNFIFESLMIFFLDETFQQTVVFWFLLNWYVTRGTLLYLKMTIPLQEI